MEIQRQSDYYGLDRPDIQPIQLSAQQITDFTRGVGIPQGMLNTAWRHGEPWIYAPENATPDESEEYDWTNQDIEDEEALHALENHIPENHMAPELDDLVYRRGPHDPPPYPEPIPNAVPGEGGYEFLVHHRHADIDLPYREDFPGDDEDEDELEDVPLEVPARGGIANQLMQAEGEEIEAIGLYNEFLDKAQAAGDEQAASVLQEAINDEHDHANNFAQVLNTEQR